MLRQPLLMVLLAVVLLTPGPVALASDDGESWSVVSWFSEFAEWLDGFKLVERLTSEKSDDIPEDEEPDDGTPADDVGLVIEPNG